MKKLKKKKKLLRKNKLHPSDDEYEMSDAQTTPKKKAIPWNKSPSPKKGLHDENGTHSMLAIYLQQLYYNLYTVNLIDESKAAISVSCFLYR